MSKTASFCLIGIQQMQKEFIDWVKLSVLEVKAACLRNILSYIVAEENCLHFIQHMMKEG